MSNEITSVSESVIADFKNDRRKPDIAMPILDKLFPYDLNAERGILGCALLSPVNSGGYLNFCFSSTHFLTP